LSRKIALVPLAERPKPEAVSGEAPVSESLLRFPRAVQQPVRAGEVDSTVPASSSLDLPPGAVPPALWELDIAEVAGHNLEARGRQEVNRMLGEGWRLLHVYTLRYREGEIWRERPMAILGRLRGQNQGAVENESAASQGGNHENPARCG